MIARPDLSDASALAGRRPRGRAWRNEITTRPTLLLLPLLVLFVVVALSFPALPSDEGHYVELARNLTDGHYTGLGWRAANPGLEADRARPDLWFGPGLPLALTPFVALDLPIEIIRLTGPVLLFLTVIVFFHLLQLYMRRGFALTGAYGLGLYFPFWTLLPNLHSEPLALFLIVTMLYVVAKAVRTGSPRFVLIGGLVIGWLAVTRVIFGWVATVLLVAFVVWWLLSRRPVARRLVAMYGLGLVLCIPWLAFTYSVTDRPFLWGNSGSLSLYWITSPYPGDLGDWQGAFDVFGKEQLAPHRDLFERLRGLDPVEQNIVLERAAFDQIQDEPLKYLSNLAANVSRMWFNMPFSYTEEDLSTLFYMVPNSLLLWALVLSGALLVRRRRSIPLEAVPFGAFMLVTFGVHALLSAYPRMLMPIVPVIFWFVFYALTRYRVVIAPADAAAGGRDPAFDQGRELARGGAPD